MGERRLVRSEAHGHDDDVLAKLVAHAKIVHDAMHVRLRTIHVLGTAALGRQLGRPKATPVCEQRVRLHKVAELRARVAHVKAALGFPAANTNVEADLAEPGHWNLVAEPFARASRGPRLVHRLQLLGRKWRLVKRESMANACWSSSWRAYTASRPSFPSSACFAAATFCACPARNIASKSSTTSLMRFGLATW